MAAEPGRTLIFGAGDELSGTPTVSESQEIEGWAQVILEVVPDEVVGTLGVIVELAHEDEQFFAEPWEDGVNANVAAGVCSLPIVKLKRTLTALTGPIVIPVIAPGYKYMRVSLTATSGNAMVWLLRTRLSSP